MKPSGQGKRRVEVDHDLCVGSQMCMGIAPHTFSADEGGQAVVSDPGGDPIEDQREAEMNCPVAAITVEDNSDEDHK